MLKTVTVVEGDVTRVNKDVVCSSSWDKDAVIEICSTYGLDIPEDSEKFWNYLSEWLDGCEYFPCRSEDIYEEVKEVMKRRTEWES